MPGWPSLVRRWPAKPMILWITRVQIPFPASKPPEITNYTIFQNFQFTNSYPEIANNTIFQNLLFTNSNIIYLILIFIKFK